LSDEISAVLFVTYDQKINILYNRIKHSHKLTLLKGCKHLTHDRFKPFMNPRNHAASRPKGREPSGNDRLYPKSEPGLPNYFFHESRLPCGITFNY
jgi:hypothetical protein